jgi:hypothetical protein
MSAVAERLRPLTTAASGIARRVVAAPAAWRHRHADARARAICPVDSWAFTPLYTDGTCPVCGWRPEGYVYAPPPLTPYVRYWGTVLTVAVVSVVMCLLVVTAYNQG